MKDAYLTNFNKDYYDIIVGADRGALHAIKNNIIPDISVGDFDSVNSMEFEIIKNNSKKLIKLNSIKDNSDTNEAISLVSDYDNIEILGGIQGKRIEHLFANIIDLINHPNVLIKDEYSLIETITNDKYIVREDYKYISIYAIDDSIIDLRGFKYNLYNYNLNVNDPLCLSNEIINNPKINLKKGKLLIIYSHGD